MHRRVRIGVEGEGAVLRRRLVRTDTLLDGFIVCFQTNKVCTICACGLYYLPYGKEQLAHHVPVDTTQSFVLIESAGAAGEGMVMESRLIEVEHLLLLFGTNRQALQRLLQKRSITEVGIEMHLAFAVLSEESGVEQSLHKG